MARIFISDPEKTPDIQHIRDYEDSGYLEKALNSANDEKGGLPAKKPSGSKKLTATVAATANSRSTSTNASRIVRPCLFCKTEEHSSSRCPAIITIDKRLETLRKQRRCDECFRSLHAKQEECAFK